MPTNIDKALFQAPKSLEEEGQTLDMFEIEIIDPDAVEDVPVKEAKPSIDDFDANLAEYLEDGDILKLMTDLVADIDNDKGSRKDWEKAYVDGLKLLGLQIEERTEPWDGASGVFHPLLTEAVVRFQSETITETFPAQGPVKTKIVGRQTPAKTEAAQRVQEDMNYQLTEKMHEFRGEHERMLWSLPAAGSAFKKVYFDPNLGRQTSLFVPAEDIILPYGASDIQTCYRVSHVMRKTENDLKKLQAAGFYRDTELGSPDKAIDAINKAKDKETGFADLNDERFHLIEAHAELVIEGDPMCVRDEDGEPCGIALPYVLTFIRGSNTVLAIRRNWNEGDELHLKRQHFVHYQYIPGFGAYGFGLFHLIGGFANSATSLMRQLIDAGTLSNLPGGLKTRGLRIKGDDTPIAPGEWRDVDVGSGTIMQNIMPLPYKDPSATLYNLLNTVVEEGRRFAATADMKVADMSAQAPVGTTLALLERQLKVLTAVQARVHYALKQELQLIKNIIRDYTDDAYTYEAQDAEDEGPRVKKADYDIVEVIPVSDPNAATMSQRLVQYQAVIQLSQTAPEIYNMPVLHRGMLEVLGIKNADKLVPLPDDQKPKDPVTENMCVLRGEPVKAFLYQDHQSHIQVHTSAMQDPIIMQLVGQNPKAPQIQAAMMAHIAEHVGYGYRQKIEQQLGMPLPPEDEKLPPQIELALSQMMARAAQQVLQQSQQIAAQQQAQQQAQDPVLQLQQKELAIKEKEVALKEKKVQVDAAAMADKLALEEKKLQVDAAHKADQLEQNQDEDPQVTQLRLGQELGAERARVAQEGEMARMRQQMEQERHQQQMAQKNEAHRQNLEHQREQAKARIEAARAAAAAKPKTPSKDKP